MIRYGNPQEVEEYFADGSVNQSYLKLLLKGVEHLGKEEKVLYYEEKGHFKIGSAVDVWITQGTTNFNEQYYVSEGQKPSDAMISMVRMLFDSIATEEGAPNHALEDVREEEILEALNFHKYQMRWKEPTRIQKVIDEGADYWEELKESHGKVILDGIESRIVSNIVMSLNSHKYTGHYFKEEKGVDIYYQVPIYFVIDDVPCKALLDMLIVNHNTRRLLPIDIKTLGDFTSNFPKSVRQRGYNFQGSFYTEALLELILGRAQTTIKGLDAISGYGLDNFRFLVESTTFKKNPLTDEVHYNQGHPMVYELSDWQNRLGRKGRPELEVVGHSHVEKMSESRYPIKYNEIYGFKYALELHKWHLENGFEEDREVFNNEGVILLE